MSIVEKSVLSAETKSYGATGIRENRIVWKTKSVYQEFWEYKGSSKEDSSCHDRPWFWGWKTWL